MAERHYWVYIMASRSLTLYIGVTGHLQRRVAQHKNHTFDGFTAQYNIDRLVYFERYHYINNAINREKQLKRWRREKKLALIKRKNPTWIDLSADWDTPTEMQVPPLRSAVPRSGRDDKS
jgi:putative endonuclease